MSRILSACLVLLATFSSNAQFKNIIIDPGTASGLSPAEPTISISLRNPQNIVAASSANAVYFTKDGGMSWKKVTVNAAAANIGNPVIVSDEKGTFYYFHLVRAAGDQGTDRAGHILCHRSEDGGETWDEGMPVDPAATKLSARLAATVDSKGDVYVTWTQFDQYKSAAADCHSIILYSKSGSGKKWSKPLLISQTPGGCQDNDATNAGGGPAVSSDGKQFIAWANNEKIYMDRTYDGDMWLSNDITVTDQKGGWDFTVPGLDRCNGLPVLLIDNMKGGVARGSLYMSWADQRNGATDTDIWFMRTSTYGDNWTTPLRINDDALGKHQYLPAMTIDHTTGILYILYYDRRAYDDNQTDVYLAYSADYGLNFKNLKVSETPFTPQADKFSGNYISISAYKGVITPIWTRMDNGQTSIVTTVVHQDDLFKPAATKGKKKK